MPWGVAAAAVGAAGSIAGGLIGSNASSSAAKQQQQAQQNSLNWIQHIYGQTQSNLQPFINSGQGAIGQLSSFYGLPGSNPGGATQAYQQFQQTPFYQFPLQQANLATNRALAASGLIGSGGQLRDLSQLNAGYASQGLGQYLSGLGSIASGGQGAAGNLGSIGVGTGAQIGQAYTNIGNAGAQGSYNTASAINGGIQNGIGALLGNNNNGTGLGSSSYGGIGSLFSGSGPFSANTLNSTFGTQFGEGTFPSASNPNAIVPGYQADNYTPA